MISVLVLQQESRPDKLNLFIFLWQLILFKAFGFVGMVNLWIILSHSLDLFLGGRYHSTEYAEFDNNYPWLFVPPFYFMDTSVLSLLVTYFTDVVHFMLNCVGLNNFCCMSEMEIQLTPLYNMKLVFIFPCNKKDFVSMPSFTSHFVFDLWSMLLWEMVAKFKCRFGVF